MLASQFKCTTSNVMGVLNAEWSILGLFQIQNEPQVYSIESSLLLHKNVRPFKGEMAWSNIDNLAFGRMHVGRTLLPSKIIFSNERSLM